MASAYFSGYVALGSISGTTFTEISSPSYVRQPVGFSDPVFGYVATIDAVRFVDTVGLGFGTISAVAVYTAVSNSSLLFTWKIPPITHKGFQNVTLDTWVLSFKFLDSTNLTGAVVPYALPSMAQGSIVATSRDGAPVYAGDAMQSGGGGGTGTTPATVSAAGTDQASATQLTALVSIVTTTPSNGGVRVTNTLNEMQTIVNEGTNALNIYPLAGMTFVGLAQNAPFQIGPGKAVGIELTSVTQGHILFGSPSAFG